MNLSRDKEIKVNDLEQHLKGLRAEIISQTNILNLVIKKKEQVEQETDKVTEELAKDCEYNLQVTKDTEEKLKSIKDLENKSGLLVVKLAKVKKESEDISMKITRSYEIFNNNLEVYNSVILDLQETISNYKKEVKKLDDNIIKLNKIIGDKNIEINKLDDITLKKKVDIEDTKAKHFKLIEKNKLELEDIERKINVEKKKIELPMKSLEDFKFELKKKENNLNILITRFRKEFKKLHPDLNPQI